MGTLAVGDWSIEKMLSNGASTIQTIGGSLFVLLGMIAIVVSAVHAFNKVTSDQSNKRWGRIAMTFVLGGLMLSGGFALFMNIAKGAQTTVDQLGQGFIHLIG